MTEEWLMRAPLPSKRHLEQVRLSLYLAILAAGGEVKIDARDLERPKYGMVESFADAEGNLILRASRAQ